MNTNYENQKVRKLIVGQDPKDGFAWVVGQPVSKAAEIHSIEFNERHFVMHGKERFDIFIEQNGEVFFWKSTAGLPYIVEFDCNF